MTPASVSPCSSRLSRTNSHSLNRSRCLPIGEIIRHHTTKCDTPLQKLSPAAHDSVNSTGMSRDSLVPLIDAFEQRGREVAYVHHRGYRTLRWTYGEVA